MCYGTFGERIRLWGLFMRKTLLAAASLLACGAINSGADARVVVHVSKSRQMMYVYVDGYLQHAWPVSTARGGYSTPSGSYSPTGFDPYHRSSKYHNSPMPNSIFFSRGYAIHGSYDIRDLGRPASHGCNPAAPRRCGGALRPCAGLGRHAHHRFTIKKANRDPAHRRLPAPIFYELEHGSGRKSGRAS